MPDEIVEMRWRCPDGLCATENPGMSHTCRNCLRPKGPDVVDYFPDGDGSTLPALTALADLEQATAGGAAPGERRDRVCYRCGQAQQRHIKDCEHCGAPLAESRRDAQEQAFTPRASPHRMPLQNPRLPMDATASVSFLTSASIQSFKRQRSVLRWFIVLLCVALFGVGVYAGCRTTDTDVIVTHVAWVHSQRVERLVMEPHEGFDVPTGAHDVRDVEERHHHFEEVFDRWETTDESYWNVVRTGEVEKYRCTVRVPGKKPPCHRGKCVPQGNGTAVCPQVCPGAPMVEDPNGTCERPKTKRVLVPKQGKKKVMRRESRKKMWHAWSEARWVRAPELDASESGLSTELVEPRTRALDPARERALPVERSYDVGLTDAGHRTTIVHPATSTEFVRFPPGSRHVLRTSLLGPISVDPPGSGHR